MTTERQVQRDGAVDALRGLAIGAMVWGHLGIAIYDPDGRGQPSTTLEAIPPLWTEVVGGLAPALFLFVCGMMVQRASDHRRGGLKHQLLRMVALLGVGATIDVLFWRIRPFTTVDVLYCIALTLPITHLVATRTPRTVKWLAPGLVFAVTPILQRLLGYSDYPIEMSLSGRTFVEVPNQTSILNHWLVDGWFPLFPWLGFALLGAVVHERRGAHRDDVPRHPKTDRGLLGVGMLALGNSLVLGWPDASVRVEARLIAGGAFMPPDAGYLLASIGAALLLLVVLDTLAPSAILAPLRVVGRHPLFIYVVHFPLVKVMAKLLPRRVTLIPAIALILVALGALAVSAILSRRLFRGVWRRVQSSPRTSGVDGSRK